MLTNITIENFKSYKEKTKVDFRATGYEILNKTNKQKTRSRRTYSKGYNPRNQKARTRP